MKSDSLHNRLKGSLWTSSSLDSNALLFLFQTYSGWQIARCFANASWQFIIVAYMSFKLLWKGTHTTLFKMCAIFQIYRQYFLWKDQEQRNSRIWIVCLFLCCCFLYQLFACCGVWRVGGRTVRRHLSDTRALSSVSSERDQHLPMFPLLTNCQEYNHILQGCERIVSLLPISSHNTIQWSRFPFVLKI